MRSSPGLFRFFAMAAFFCCYFIAASQQSPVPPSLRSFDADTTTILKDIEIAGGLATIKPDSAIKKYKEVVVDSRKAGFSKGEAIALYRTGRIYYALSLYDSAIVYLNKALHYSAYRQELAEMLPMMNVDIAEAYQSKGDYELAVQYFYSALSANKKLLPGIKKDNDEANINISLGAIFSLLNQYSKAHGYLDQANLLAQKHNDLKLTAYILLQKGVMAREQPDKLPQSIKYFKAALSIALKNQFHSIEFLAVGNLGAAYYLNNNMPDALKQVEKMSELLEKGHSNNLYQKIDAMISIGEIYLAAKYYDKAEFYLLKGLRLAEKMGTGNRLEAHAMLYKLYKQKGMYSRSLKHLEVYHRLKDELDGRDVNKYVNELEVNYRTAEKDKSIINKQLLIERQQNKINRGRTIINIGVAIFLILLVCFSLVVRLYRNRSLFAEQAQKIVQLKGIMQGEQGERLRIAGELHDGIGGILATLKMKFNNMRKQDPNWTDNKTFSEIDYLIGHTANEIRRASHNLMPDALTRYALKDALVMYRDDVCMEVDNLTIEMLFLGREMDAIHNTISLVIYRMVQEIIQNMLKHSNAKQGVIQIIYSEKRIKIMAEDDGIGFDPAAENIGIGLKTLHSRVSALRGSIAINSGEGKGTTIFIELDTNILT
jgi:signal transduction histidine kinase